MLFEKNINIINLNVSSIICDTPLCNYRNDNVEISQYSEYVNKKCPKCSSILLTEMDCKLVSIAIKLTKIINNVSNFIIPNYFLRKISPTKNNSVITLIKINENKKVNISNEDK